MNIIIAGAGEVGNHLAKLLAEEHHSITLVDLDADKLKYAESHYDVFCIRGSSTSFSVLKEARIERCDLLICATSSEEINISTALIGKKLGAKKTIARISNVEYITDKEIFDIRSMGIDEIISPESLAAREITRLIKAAALTDTFEFEGGKLCLLGIHIDENSPIINRSVSECAHFNPDYNFITVAVNRSNETIIPRGNTVFQSNDYVYFITTKNGLETVLSLSGRKNRTIKNIMILGGSKVGVYAALKLSENYDIKLIEISRNKCDEIVDRLKDTLVLNGDGRDVSFLEEESINDMDAFIAVTGDSETNILSCLVAKNHGVEKTIALVENIDYIHLSQRIGIDTMINKKLIAANFIFRYIRKGEVVSLTGIHGVNAEVMEYKVKKGSKVTRNKIKDLKFPKQAIIAGVIRDGKEHITMAEFQLQENDLAVVFALDTSISATDEFFK